MSNIVRIEVDNPDELRDAGAYDTGALIRTQWSATEAGAFVDISGTGSDPTLALVNGTRLYLAYDPAGTTTTWYRTRYENAGGTRVSEWSPVFQVGAAGPLCTLAQVKVAIFPDSYTDTVSDAVIIGYIQAVTQEIQEYTRRQFVSDPGSTVYYFDVTGPDWYRSLYIGRGIQSVSELAFATVSQPATGGTYTAVTAANVLLRPLPQDRRPGFPADTIRVSDLDLTTRFYSGYNTLKLTAILGFKAIPADIEHVAVGMVVRRWQARKGGQTDTVGALGFGGEILRFTSPEEWATLTRYRDPVVG